MRNAPWLRASVSGVLQADDVHGTVLFGMGLARAPWRLTLALLVLSWTRRTEDGGVGPRCIAAKGVARSEAPAAPPTYAQYLNYTVAELQAATSNKCHYMEQAFTEYFDAAELNATRWQDSSLHGLFHCTRGRTKAGADRFCTMALRQNLQVGTVLPFYPGKTSTLGAVLTMSRYPCSSDDAVLAGQCCRKLKCANYSGAHVVSRGCILYGTLEAELAVHIPGALPNNPGNPAMFDWGTYVNGGKPDPTWNEIDQIFEIGPNGTVEYHTTFFNPEEHKMVFDLFTVPSYNGYMAAAYKNYTINWTPKWMAWSVDSKLYRNTSAENAAANHPPWRPMTYRLIFRTNNGTNPGVAVPDAHVYVRRIAYTPMAPASRPGLLRRVVSLLLPSAGALFWVRSGISLTCWVAGVFYLRRPEDAAADSEAVALWERERGQLKSLARSRRRGAEARDAASPGDDDDDEATADGTPLQLLGRAVRAERRYGALS